MVFSRSLIEIHGNNFAIKRSDNFVTVSGRTAVVVFSSPTILRVITDLTTITGPLHVRVGLHTTTGPFPFVVHRYPKSGSEKDGPPIFYAGTGMGVL
jgi:hypothetical protein